MGLYINAKTATKTELQLKVMFWINSPVEDRGSKAALERPLSRIVGHRPFRRHPYRGSWFTGRFGGTPIEDRGSQAVSEAPLSRIVAHRPLWSDPCRGWRLRGRFGDTPVEDRPRQAQTGAGRPIQGAKY